MNPYTTPESQPADSTPVPVSPPFSRPKNYWPGPIAKVLAVLSLLAVVVCQSTEVIGDRAFTNIATLVGCFVAFISIYIWFVFRSDYPTRLRFGILTASTLAVVLFFVLFALDHVTGEMIPVFRPRLEASSSFPYFKKARLHDERLGRLERQETAAAPAESEIASSPYDFPGFLGPDRTAGVDWPEVKLARDWKSHPPRQVWQIDIGAGWAGFAVVGQRAVTLEQRGEEEVVSCYDPRDGKLVWSHADRARHENAAGYIGPRSTPTIHDGRVYTLGATGIFHGFDLAKGTLLWTHDLLERYGLTVAESEQGVTWGRSNSPLVVDDVVIIPGAKKTEKIGATLVAFDRRTGNVAWEAGHEQVSYASPSVATFCGVKQIVIVNENCITAHDVTSGEELWKQEWPGNKSGHSNGDANVSQAVPLSGDRFFVSKGYAAGAAVFQVKRDQGEWTVEEVWRKSNLMKTKFTNVALYQGHVYGLSDGLLECVDVETGERSWAQPRRGRYQQGQLLRVNDLLLVQCENPGDLALVAADPAAHQELGKIPALADQTWNNPAVFCRRDEKGRLHCFALVRNSVKAACLELPLAE